MVNNSVGGSELLRSNICYLRHSSVIINIIFRINRSDVLPSWPVRQPAKECVTICVLVYMSACMPLNVLMCVLVCILCYTCSISTMRKPMGLKESVSISINVAQVCNVNINTEKTISPLPELWAASRSRRQRWWPVWSWRRWGCSFLQLELSPSGNTHGQKNPISKHARFKLNTHAITKLGACCKIGCCGLCCSTAKCKRPVQIGSQ